MNISAQDNIDQDILFEIQEKPFHHYRTEIPNIVFDLDLSDTAFRLYTVIKRIAGDSGASWASQTMLGQKCKCDRKTVRKALQELIKPHALIGNKPLILIKKRKKENGAKDTHCLYVVDIWDENWDKFKKRKPVNHEEKEGGYGENLPMGGGEKFTHKEEPCFKEEQQQLPKKVSSPEAYAVKAPQPVVAVVSQKDRLRKECLKLVAGSTDDEFEAAYHVFQDKQGITSPANWIAGVMKKQKLAPKKQQPPKERSEAFTSKKEECLDYYTKHIKPLKGSKFVVSPQDLFLSIQFQGCDGGWGTTIIEWENENALLLLQKLKKDMEVSIQKHVGVYDK